MTLTNRHVTILGAGVAGLAMARACALRGAKVTLFEQAEAISDVGAGLQISPNGAVVLQALGLGAELEVMSLRAAAVELRNAKTDTLVTRLEVGKLRPDAGWRFIHRADLIDVLAQGVRGLGVELRLLQKVASVDLSGARPKVVMATGAKHECDILIGADGLHSPTRIALNGAAVPFFTKQVAWRALLPCAPDEPAIAEVHMGAGRHLVSYPLRGGLMRNIVAVQERAEWTAEGWSQPADLADLRRSFADFGPRVQGWLEQVGQAWLWGLFRHEVAQRWQAQLPQGCVALIGDAAHPTLPFLAQGANMALEDAYSLTLTLEKQGLGGQSLQDWQNQRAPRCAKIVAAATKNARNYHLRGPIRPLAHMVMRIGGKIAPEMALSRFDWIYHHDVTA